MKKIIVTAAFSILTAATFSQNVATNNGAAAPISATPPTTAMAPAVSTGAGVVGKEKILRKDIKRDSKAILTEIKDIRAEITDLKADIKQRQQDIKEGNKTGALALTNEIKKDRADIRTDRKTLRKDFKELRRTVRAARRIARHERHHLHHLAKVAAHKVTPGK